MFRKRKSKKVDEAGDVSIRSQSERDAYDPSPNGHVTGEPHEQQDDLTFNVELQSVFDEGTKEAREGGQRSNAESNDEERPTADDDDAGKVDAIWQQRLEDDPAGALDDARAKVKGLGYQLAYAGNTFGKPPTQRTYHITLPDDRMRFDVFRNGNVDLTLLEVCVWSDLTFKRWKYDQHQKTPTG